ncbi:hypothetical protein RN001_005340 [Aquatica leii]|uniref:Aminotransferase class I/classII large domain-containing protein n=1 Tax=Aquatica leii TaxID=1421715 RepID=A0AAN7PJQ4_9COLE|nr:hypothetical protein RN001_005340 [Aquatica leii]
MIDAEIIKKFQVPSRYVDGPCFWDDYDLLAKKHTPINLGQGAPDFLPSQHVLDALAQSITCKNGLVHQYTRSYGHPRLVHALAKLFGPMIKQTIDPYKDIAICAGAYGALHSSILAHVEKGDEVIIIEPSFDCYAVMVQAAGGTVRYVPLRLNQIKDDMSSNDWVLNSTELRNAFNHKTKAIILNTPHNPFGKVFSEKELMEIGNLCKKWNVLCISDEVYEWLAYEPKQHIKIASLPGMWERTITIGSAGKTFCITGWKIGWSIGPEHLIKNVQFELSFQPSSVHQEAVAIAVETEIERFDKPDCYFKTLRNELQTKKDHMLRFLKNAGMKPIIPDAGIFVVADWTPLETKIDSSSEKDFYKDFRFTKWFIKNVGILGIPISGFYSETNKKVGENFVRFCFVKKDEKLYMAEEALKKWACRQ